VEWKCKDSRAGKKGRKVKGVEGSKCNKWKGKGGGEERRGEERRGEEERRKRRL